jgi:hypothetical protein
MKVNTINNPFDYEPIMSQLTASILTNKQFPAPARPAFPKRTNEDFSVYCPSFSIFIR